MDGLTEFIPPPRRAFSVLTPDGLRVSAQEWGDSDGPEILFIHGFSQSHLTWARQIKSELAKTFRLLTYDARGHGGSDKPLDPVYYKDDRRWAAEVNAVIQAAGLQKPAVVAWSYGGRILLDYLTHYSDSHLAGINFVAALTTGDIPDLYGPGLAAMRKMTSENLVENIHNTIAFLRFCTARPLPQAEYQWLLASTMLVPPQVRLSLLGRPLAFEAMLKSLAVPVLLSHGLADQLIRVKMTNHTARLIPHAITSFYEDAGHMPFWEAPERFQRELAELAG